VLGDKVFSFLRKRKNFEIFSTCSDGGDIEAGDGACGERGTAGRPWGKSQKNDKVFSFLRKRKNFEIFSTCSDGGDIEAGDGACRERGMAGRPGGKSRKNDKVSSSLRERKNFDTFSTCSDRGGCRGAWSAVHASPMQQGAAGRRLSRLPLAVHGLIL